jgi:hypothetical protein
MNLTSGTPDSNGHDTNPTGDALRTAKAAPVARERRGKHRLDEIKQQPDASFTYGQVGAELNAPESDREVDRSQSE